MDKQKTIDALNQLIIINNDRIEGYNTAADGTEDADLKRLFGRLATNSQRFNSELSTEVQRLGGEEADGTKVTGKVFRAWMDVKAALTGKDRKAVLNSCEFGEDKALESYKDVLHNEREHLTPEQFNIISAQKQIIKADHDEIKKLRDAAANASS